MIKIQMSKIMLKWQNVIFNALVVFLNNIFISIYWILASYDDFLIGLYLHGHAWTQVDVVTRK